MFSKVIDCSIQFTFVKILGFRSNGVVAEMNHLTLDMAALHDLLHRSETIEFVQSILKLVLNWAGKYNTFHIL